MGNQKFIISSFSVLRKARFFPDVFVFLYKQDSANSLHWKARKALVPASFAVPFSLCVVHKESLCPSSGGINRLMLMTPDMSWKIATNLTELRTLLQREVNL
jgi:hypothetical protein